MRNIKSLIINLSMTLLVLWVIIPWNEALAQWGRHMGPGMMGGVGMGWFGRIYMIAFWILFLVGLVFFLKWLVRSTGGDRACGGRSRAIEILKERYARGEINQIEFEAMKMNLSK